jgi:hypothetical protein
MYNYEEQYKVNVCLGKTLTALVVWFHFNVVGVCKLIDDFRFMKCHFLYHSDPYTVVETDQVFTVKC